jgi:hypothetical protein
MWYNNPYRQTPPTMRYHPAAVGKELPTMHDDSTDRKPKMTINGKSFTLKDAYFADKDGNRFELTNAVFPVPPDVPQDSEPIVFGGSIPAVTWTFTITDRKTFNTLLLLLDPREWERRNWWRLPVLWKRER